MSRAALPSAPRRTLAALALACALAAGEPSIAWAQADSDSVEALRYRLESTLPGDSTPAAAEISVSTATRDSALAQQIKLEAMDDRPGYDSLGVARARLHAILQHREFGFARPQHGPDWIERALDWIARHMPKQQHRTAAHAGNGTAVAILLVAVLVVLLVLVLVRLGGQDPGVQPEQDEDDEQRRSTRWRRRADEAAARGAFREAVQCAYWAAAHRLSERGVVPIDPARTHRETLRHVPREHAAHAPLEVLVRRYERVWYGHEPVGPEAWDDTDRQLEALE